MSIFWDTEPGPEAGPRPSSLDTGPGIKKIYSRADHQQQPMADIVEESVRQLTND
jgi:hypothetical protein